MLDVRTCAAEDVKLKSVKCAAEILKEKVGKIECYLLIGANLSFRRLCATRRTWCPLFWWAATAVRTF